MMRQRGQRPRRRRSANRWLARRRELAALAAIRRRMGVAVAGAVEARARSGAARDRGGRGRRARRGRRRARAPAVRGDRAGSPPARRTILRSSTSSHCSSRRGSRSTRPPARCAATGRSSTSIRRSSPASRNGSRPCHDVARKHRVRPEALPALLAETEARLAALAESADAATARGAGRRRPTPPIARSPNELSAKREFAAHELETRVSEAMQHLAMAGGRLEIALEPLATPASYGAEQIEFRVASHPKQPLGPLAKVASGGELSRIALAIQVVTSEIGEVPTLVFDEVDAGIGGAVAATVGRLLQTLGTRRQVLCVTHLPQVAAFADTHFRVTKRGDAADRPRGGRSAGAGPGSRRSRACSPAARSRPRRARMRRELLDQHRRRADGHRPIGQCGASDVLVPSGGGSDRVRRDALGRGAPPCRPRPPSPAAAPRGGGLRLGGLRRAPSPAPRPGAAGRFPASGGTRCASPSRVYLPAESSSTITNGLLAIVASMTRHLPASRM